jgi:hypothetical protein
VLIGKDAERSGVLDLTGECTKPAMGGWGTPIGKGKYVLPDGSTHEGQFENGRPVGWGVFTFTNGRRYEGEWLNGEPHGAGVFTWKDGKRYSFRSSLSETMHRISLSISSM